MSALKWRCEACGKQAFATLEAAVVAIKFYEPGPKGRPAGAYPCKKGGKGWHLTRGMNETSRLRGKPTAYLNR